MSAPWISLLVGAVVMLLFVAYALRRHNQAAAEAAYVEDVERLAKERSAAFALLARLSSELSGVMDVDALKRTLADELPALTGSDDFWVVAKLGTWTLVAGEPAEPGSVVPRGLRAKAETWECFPLNAGGKTVGLMGTRQPADGFTDDHRRMLTTVATLMASAVKNIQLLNRTRELSMIDPLTRSLQRHFGVEALSREMRRQRRSQASLCVAILDLDLFKELNDAHGHPVGDRALAMVGRVLREGLRASDVACRYGGDEFLIVLPDTSLTGAVQALDNLRRRIGATSIDGVNGLVSLRGVSTSIGVTAVRLSEEDTSLPIARADAAMSEAKRSGRDRVTTG